MADYPRIFIDRQMQHSARREAAEGTIDHSRLLTNDVEVIPYATPTLRGTSTSSSHPIVMPPHNGNRPSHYQAQVVINDFRQPQQVFDPPINQSQDTISVFQNRLQQRNNSETPRVPPNDQFLWHQLPRSAAVEVSLGSNSDDLLTSRSSSITTPFMRSVDQYNSSEEENKSRVRGVRNSAELNYDWVDERAAKKYECAICLQVQCDPTQTECGHRFCKGCLTTWFNKRQPNALCPSCNIQLDISRAFPDKYAAREITDLHIYCIYREKGCQATFALSDLERHLAVCDTRNVVCPHCQSRMLPQMLQDHVSAQCMYAPAKCVFEQFGCQLKVCRSQMQQHLISNIELHLRYIADALNKLLSELGMHFDTTEGGALKLVTGQQPQRIATHISQSLERSTVSGNQIDRCSSLPNELSQNHLPVNQRLLRNDASLFGTITTVEKFEQPMDMSTQQKLTQGVISSLSIIGAGSDAWLRQWSSAITENMESLDKKIQRLERVVNSSLLEEKMNNLERRLARAENLETKMKETMSRLRQQEDSMLAYICKGDFIWRIEDFTRKRQDAVDNVTTVLHSSGFYTRTYGYKMCIRMNPNGVDASVGKHLSLFVHVMKGEYDELLTWPFQGTIQLMILDQSDVPENNKHHIVDVLNTTPTLTAFQRPTTNRNHRGFGYTEFAPLSTICNPQYLKNDVLIIRATVTEAN